MALSSEYTGLSTGNLVTYYCLYALKQVKARIVAAARYVRCVAKQGAFEPRRSKESPVKRTLAKRLWQDRVVTGDGCWVGVGYVNKTTGYATLSMKDGPRGSVRRGSVHRLAYELWRGPIPVGYEVDHVWDRGCRSRACFNPDHLEAVTNHENGRRAARTARFQAEMRRAEREWDSLRFDPAVEAEYRELHA